METRPTAPNRIGSLRFLTAKYRNLVAIEAESGDATLRTLPYHTMYYICNQNYTIAQI